MRILRDIRWLITGKSLRARAEAHRISADYDAHNAYARDVLDPLIAKRDQMNDAGKAQSADLLRQWLREGETLHRRRQRWEQEYGGR